MPVLVGLVIAVTVIVGALAGILGERPSTASTGSTPPGAPSPTSLAGDGGSRPAAPPLDGGGSIAAADGGIGDGTTVFDDELPAVANLTPELLVALQRAALDAQADGIAFVINSGWRSPELQGRLLRDAIAEYGSPEEAARWVATPTTSPHVRGEAVDMSRDAASWLSANGAQYGLCQIYANESWHYELRPEAIDLGCPAMYPDPTHDPRMN